MVKLNQKYDQLRRKREELIRLITEDYCISQVNSGLDAHFGEEDELLNLFDRAEAKYSGSDGSEVTERCID